VNLKATVLQIAVVVCAASAAQAAGGHLLTIDAQHSQMTVYVYKEGFFSFAADNHEILAPIVSGSFDEAATKVKVTVDAAKMQVLDTKMPASRRAQVQANMVGPQVLDVARFPTVAFQADAIKSAGSSHFQIDGDLTLHGQTHPITVDVTKVDAMHYTGSAVVRQTAFGITPIRIAGGLVRVKDDVKIVFTIALH
jgi:polyisoprenoid-binding protein YceI